MSEPGKVLGHETSDCMALSFIDDIKSEIVTYLKDRCVGENALLYRIAGQMVYSKPNVSGFSLKESIKSSYSREVSKFDETSFGKPPDTKQLLFRYNIGCPDFVPHSFGSSSSLGTRSSSFDGSDDDTPLTASLKFDSSFESGNLKYACQKNNTYYLILDKDIFSRGHTQWFYFAVKSDGSQDMTQFKIMNFRKPKSLYSLGMKVWTYSNEAASWEDHLVSEVSYECTEVPRTSGAKDDVENLTAKRSDHSCFYSLSFSFDFGRKSKVVYFAYSIPYTYTMLRSYMKTVEMHADVRMRALCQSLCGLDCHLLTITNQTNQSGSKASAIETPEKITVLITCRVHPGETNSSWVLHGFLQFLLSDNPESKLLRDRCIFKIVPMMNPDGVVVGNSRCSLAGVDLNRRWKKPNESLHPTVHAVRKMVQKTPNKKLCVFIDLHGHSRKQGYFLYCSGVTYSSRRELPQIMSNVSAGNFRLRSCRFGTGKGKRETARVVAHMDLGIPKSFTIETSFFGFGIREFHEIGRELAKSLIVMTQPQMILSGQEDEFDDEEEEDERMIDDDFDETAKQRMISTGRVLDEEDDDHCSSCSGSDSNPSEDNIEIDESILISRTLLLSPLPLLSAPPPPSNASISRPRQQRPSSSLKKSISNSMRKRPNTSQSTKRILTASSPVPELPVEASSPPSIRAAAPPPLPSYSSPPVRLLVNVPSRFLTARKKLFSAGFIVTPPSLLFSSLKTSGNGSLSAAVVKSKIDEEGMFSAMISPATPLPASTFSK